MYTSGKWRGFWQQEGWGRQPMAAFRLRFAPTGEVTGGGTDVVGRFDIAGECDPATGAVAFLKMYRGKHTVEYVGGPDGEGCIGGEWTVSDEYAGKTFTYRGPFLLKPDLPPPTGRERIEQLF